MIAAVIVGIVIFTLVILARTGRLGWFSVPPVGRIPLGWKTAITLVALAFGGVLLCRMYHYDWSLKALWANESAWFYILGIAIVIFALSRIKLGSVSAGVPKTGSFSAQLYTSMLVFALLLYALWGVSPDAKLFTTPEGWVAILIYVVAMTAAALVAINFKGFWAKLTPALMLLIFFSFTGERTWTLLNSDGVFERRTHIAASLGKLFNHDSSVSGQVAVATAPGCDGTLTVFRYDQGQAYDVNKNTCQVRAYVMQGCVNWYDAAWSPIGKTCQGGPLPFGIRYMKPESVAVVRLNHCRNNAPGILVDSCA